MKISDEKLAKVAELFKDYSSISVSTTEENPVVITVAKYHGTSNQVTMAQVKYMEDLVNF